MNPNQISEIEQQAQDWSKKTNRGIRWIMVGIMLIGGTLAFLLLRLPIKRNEFPGDEILPFFSILISAATLIFLASILWLEKYLYDHRVIWILNKIDTRR